MDAIEKGLSKVTDDAQALNCANATIVTDGGSLTSCTLDELRLGITDAIQSAALHASRTLEGFKRAGEMLLEAKSRLQHGEFETWVITAVSGDLRWRCVADVG